MGKTKKTKVFISIVFVFVFAFLFLTSCEPAEEPENNKITNDTPPETQIDEKEAAGIIDDANWENAQNASSRSDYLNYIENTPGKYIEEAKGKIEAIDWTDALDISQFQKTLLPLIEFIENYPNSKYIPEAEQLLEHMRNDSWYSARYFAEPTLDSMEEFIEKFPGHKDAAQANEIKQDFIGDIWSMMEKGYIAARAEGDSISRCRLLIQNNTNSRLIVTAPFGVYFAANRGNVQNMLIREERAFSVEAGIAGSAYIATACMNIYRDVPDSTNYFNAEMLDEDSPLINLLKAAKQNGSSFEVTQAAIWQITDNPGKDIILSTIMYQDGTDAITEEDYEEALRLIELAKKLG